MHKENFAIIVVDDLQFSREVVKSGLLKSGFVDIRTAASADQALYQLNTRRADVVLADFWMPAMNGLEMADLIRRWDEINDRYTGIVLLTAEDTVSSIVVAFDRGVDDFISKSASQSELGARIYGAARTAVMQNELRERVRSISNRYLQAKRSKLTDAETGLANRAELEHRVETVIAHCIARGGGAVVALIRFSPHQGSLTGARLRTISNAIILSMRPMDLAARFDSNTFAVSIQYQQTETFNSDMFQRLIQRVEHHLQSNGFPIHEIQISIGVWRAEKFDPAPGITDIFEQAQRMIEPIR